MTTTLVLGGVRSGKSRYAEQLLRDRPAVTYVAPGTVPDGTDAELPVSAHRRVTGSADWSASRPAPAASSARKVEPLTSADPARDTSTAPLSRGVAVAPVSSASRMTSMSRWSARSAYGSSACVMRTIAVFRAATPADVRLTSETTLSSCSLVAVQSPRSA